MQRILLPIGRQRYGHVQIIYLRKEARCAATNSTLIRCTYHKVAALAMSRSTYSPSDQSSASQSPLSSPLYRHRHYILVRECLMNFVIQAFMRIIIPRPFFFKKSTTTEVKPKPKPQPKPPSNPQPKSQPAFFSSLLGIRSSTPTLNIITSTPSPPIPSTQSPQSTPSNPPASSNKVTTIGIAVGASISAIIFLIVIGAFYLHQRRRKSKPQPYPQNTAPINQSKQDVKIPPPSYRLPGLRTFEVWTDPTELPETELNTELSSETAPRRMELSSWKSFVFLFLVFALVINRNFQEIHFSPCRFHVYVYSGLVFVNTNII